MTEDQLRLVGVWDRPDRDLRGRVVTVTYLATAPANTETTSRRHAPLTSHRSRRTPGAHSLKDSISQSKTVLPRSCLAAARSALTEGRFVG